MQKISIYENPPYSVLEEYSRFKLGDPEIIKKYEEFLFQSITKLISSKEKYIIYTVVKAPLNNYYKKSPMILAENLSRRLNVPLIYGLLNFEYNKNDFYDYSNQRKAITPIVEGIKQAINMKVIFIDDCFVTGKSLEVNIGLFEKIAEDFISFFILDLSKSRYHEKEANTCILGEKGILFLKELVRKDKFLPTTQFVRSFEDLSKKDRNKIVSGLNSEKLDLINKAVKIYTGRG